MIDTLAQHDLLQAELGMVRNLMRDSIHCSNLAMQDCIAKLLGNPGKMLRPSLVILAARISGSNGHGEAWDPTWGGDTRVHRLAAAIEILHMATLVHDDVIDGASIRRKLPSVFASHGARFAILLGDLLFSAAFQLVADLADTRHTSRLAKAVRAISESEILQMNRIDPDNPGIRQYLHQIIGKTATLFALSCRAGAELLETSPDKLHSLQRAGYNLGMAFQIVDDIMDLDDTGANSGKTAGLDLQLGLLTMPIILALRAMHHENPKNGTFSQILKKETPSLQDIVEIRNMVRQWDGIYLARRWVQRYSDRAIRELRIFPESEALDLFLTLTQVLSQRVS